MSKKENKKVKLTPKESKFVQEYILTRNATQAAKNAGYSEKTAGVIGYENLKKPHINEAIKAECKKMEEAFHYSFVNSFSKLEEAQRLALLTVKKAFHEGCCIDETSAPDLGAFIKAEELKGKLLGLYQPENRAEVVVNVMGNVKVNGSELTLKIGKQPTVEE